MYNNNHNNICKINTLHTGGIVSMNHTPTEKELDAAREANRAYQREYTRAHPEKRREWNRNYWLRKAQKAAANRAGNDTRG